MPMKPKAGAISSAIRLIALSMLSNISASTLPINCVASTNRKVPNTSSNTLPRTGTSR